LAAAAGLLGAALASAQQLEPRSYSAAPVGLNFVVLPYVYSSGSVVTDPSLPIQNVDARIHAAALFYARTFPLFGRSASVAASMPWVWGTVTGDVFEERRTVTRSGQGDMQVRLAVNLLGGPALTPAEFARQPPKTTLGASLQVVMPTGQYDGERLINIGTNRWAFRPELGLSHPAGKWTFELHTGAWFFTPNDDFFGGQRRTQDPIFAVQGHVGYSFRPTFWLSANLTYYAGGRTTLDGVLKDDRQSNARVGMTLAVPVFRGHSLKAAWSRGATTRIGQNFTTLSAAYQYRWF
jgi:hypothetical protein